MTSISFSCHIPLWSAWICLLKNLLTGTGMLLPCLHTKPPLLKKPTSITLSLMASVPAQFSLGAPCSISSSLSMSLSPSGPQKWIQYSKKGLASAEQEQTTPSITTSSRRSWRGRLSCCQNTAGLCPACFPTGSPSSFHQSCCPSSWYPPCPRYRKCIYAVYKTKGSNKQGFLHFKLWYITVLHILTRLSQGHRSQPFHPQQWLT